MRDPKLREFKRPFRRPWPELHNGGRTIGLTLVTCLVTAFWGLVWGTKILEHIGSAHDEAELAVLVNVANQRLHGVQDDMLQLEPVERRPPGPVVERSAAELLWSVLAGAYRRLGFDRVDDEVFALLVGARLVEPTSNVDTIRVLAELGLPAPHRNTLYNCLRRCIEG